MTNRYNSLTLAPKMPCMLPSSPDNVFMVLVSIFMRNHNYFVFSASA